MRPKKQKFKHKVKLFFKSGNTIEVICDSYEFKNDRYSREFTGYNFTACVPRICFVPTQLEAFTAEDYPVE